MKTITYQQASEDLLTHINYTLSTHDGVNIASEKGAIVMIREEDYNAMQETLKLLSDKKSLKALLDGHFDRDNDKQIEKKSIEEVFVDL